MTLAIMVPEDTIVVKPASALGKRRTDLQISQARVAAASQGKITQDALSRIEIGEQWISPVQILALASFYRTYYPELEACDVCREALEAWIAAHPEVA